MPAPNRSPSASSATKETRLPDASTETTPLLGSPLPPPAYPTVMALDKNNAAGPSDKRSDYESGPSKDLEEVGGAPAAVHLHHRPNRPWPRGKIIRLLLIASAHAILIWLILTATWGRSSRKSHVQPNVPPGSGGPQVPYYCQKLHARTSEYSFDNLNEFRIVEEIRQYRERYHDVRGLINFVPASKEGETKIHATVTISNNFPHADVSAEKSDTGLVIRSRSSDASHTWHERDCTVVDVVVSVPVGTELDTLDISSNWLSVEFHRLLDLKLDLLNIELLAGGVDSKTAVPSRRTYISRAYGAVQGVWALLDLLEIHTAAGLVDIEVRPGKADPENPLPAVFNVYSTAGSVSATFPTDKESLPDREYRTRVKTEAGSIRGTYVHGSESSFESKSGSLTVRALPVGAENASFLRSSNGAGQSIVEVLPPLGLTALRNVSAAFVSKVGSVRTIFPVEWEGEVDVDTAVGSLRVEGEGLQVVEEGSHGPVGRWVRAVKGEGEKKVEVRSQAGAVEFLVQ